jgi:hypothetical protein
MLDGGLAGRLNPCRFLINHPDSCYENAGKCFVPIINLYALCKFTSVWEEHRSFSSKLYSVNSQKTVELLFMLKIFILYGLFCDAVMKTVSDYIASYGRKISEK